MWGTAMAADVLTRVRAEIDARLRELRPAVAEYAELLDAVDAIEAEARTRPEASPKPAAKLQPKAKGKAKAAVKAKPEAQRPQAAAKPKPAAMSAAEQAIVAALEHGSHTVGELGVVTAMSGGEIREGARRLLKAGKIKRAKREGRAAYALSDA
jgi:hypothetical protein